MRPALALPELESARVLLEDIARSGPTVPEYRDRLATALNAAGGALRDLGRSGEARDRHARAVALTEGLASAHPKAPAYRARLAEGLTLLARLELEPGDAAGADADARRAVGLLEGLPTRDSRQWFSLACARATLAAATGRDGSGPSTALASGLADRTVDDLRRAAAMGYRSPAAYRYEPALAPLAAATTSGCSTWTWASRPTRSPDEAAPGRPRAGTGPADTGCDRRAGPVGCALRCNRPN